MYVSTSNFGGHGSCTAHITTNRNRAKVYGTSIYLKDKQRFEIELFNPNTISYLAKISINGKSISDSGIVLKPGQRVYLERFIDSNNKFVFETYEIEKSIEALNAVINNGLVEVSFYPETTLTGSYTCFQNPAFTTGNNYCTNTGVYGNIGVQGAQGPQGPQGISSSYSSNSFGGTTTNFSCSVSDLSLESKSRSKSIETGRVEKGESSSQSFNQTTGYFSFVPSDIVSYRLVPESEKPVEVEKIRNYCTGCGNRIRKETWKFCPRCGEKF